MPTTDAPAPSGRKRLSKGVLIRLAIYVPALGFFGWRAADRALDEREAADAAFRTDVGIWLESPPGMVDLSKAIPVSGEAFLSAPPGEPKAGDVETTGTTSTTRTEGTADEAETGGDTGTTGTTGTTTGEPEPEPEPEPADSTSSSTTTLGGLPPP